MPRVTGIQKREPRQNQSGSNTNYDTTYQADRLEVSLLGDERISIYFRKAGEHSLGVGLRIPRELSGILTNIVEAVNQGAGKISIDLE